MISPRSLVATAATVLLAAAPAAAEASGIRVLSSRPGTITGGDALVAVVPAPGSDLSRIRVSLDGRDVTGAFRAAAGRLTGLVEGIGRASVLRYAAGDGGPGGALALSNHPAEGPVFSGPHQTPFICETESFRLLSGETLGPALDENCSIARRVDYAYRPAGGAELKPLADPSARPPDLATTTTLGGATVPFIVRIETGTANRGIYRIAVLHDPAGEAAPDPWTRPRGWNGRLVYVFGGGCVNGWFRQGSRTGGVADPWLLGLGYAVASSSLNVFAHNCNDVLAAETMMTVKERFVEAHGVPRFTIGLGCSGGSYQVHQIADNYPGLLDGIVPGCSFPDMVSATIPMVTDARLLDRYFRRAGEALFSEAQRQAVAGFLVLETMHNVSHKAGRISVGEFCPDVLPERLRYHPERNPAGARCDVFEHHANVYGRDRETGFARRPFDNVGVQYGLGALNDGAIDAAQFLDLNEKIGGYDADGRHRPERTRASAEAVRIAHETGRVTGGGGGLAATPIIDYRAYSDDRAAGDIHTRYHSFSMRERLARANGRADNHVMLVEDGRHGLYSIASPVLREAVLRMDRWLEALAADGSADPPADRLARAKPAGLADACWSRDPAPVKIVETQERRSGRCAALYPAPPAPREVAGAPLASDVLKCRLKPVDPADYAIRFTPDQMRRLGRIFPGGVCDWSRPGVGAARLKGTWLGFGPG